MSRHDHHCSHEHLGYCRDCDVTYCKDCKREWATNPFQLTQTPPSWQYPFYYTGDAPAVDGVRVTCTPQTMTMTGIDAFECSDEPCDHHWQQRRNASGASATG